MALTRATKEERRSAILLAAGRVFVRDGYDRARMDEVARRAHVGKGTIYEHFTSKEGLFFAYLGHRVRRNVDTLARDIGDEANPRTALRRLLRGLVGSLEEMIPLVGLYIEAWNLASTRRDLRQHVIDTFRSLFVPAQELVADLVRRGKRQGLFGSHDPKDVASLLLAVIDGLAYQGLFILRPADLPRLARRAEKLFIEGLDARP